MERAAAAREAAAGEAGTSGPSAVSRGPSCSGPSCSAPSGAQSESFWCGSSAVAQPAAAAPSDRDESTCGAGEGGAAAAGAGEGRAAATEDGEPAADASEAGGGAGSFLRSGTSPRSPDVRERQRGSSDDGAAGGAGEAVLRPGWSKRSFLASRERRGPGCAGRLPACVVPSTGGRGGRTVSCSVPRARVDTRAAKSVRTAECSWVLHTAECGFSRVPNYRGLPRIYTLPPWRAQTRTRAAQPCACPPPWRSPQLSRSGRCPPRSAATPTPPDPRRGPGLMPGARLPAR